MTRHPVCGRYGDHYQHRLYVGGQPGERTFADVPGMHEYMTYVVEFAEPIAATDPEQVETDVAAMRAVMAARGPDGYADADDAQFQAIARLVDDARDYAATNNYDDDPTCTLVEQTISGFALVCWPEEVRSPRATP